MIFHTHSPEETKQLARQLLEQYKTMQWCLLKGDLGAGKTTFVKGWAEALGVDAAGVKSPTFSLIEDHGAWIHVDLYRLAAPDPALEAELDEYAAAGKKILLEWPERLSRKPLGKTLELRFSHVSESERTIEAIPQDSAY